MNLADLYGQILLPENSISQGVVIILTCTLLICFLVTVVWCRRYKQQGMRISPDNYLANSYDYAANNCTLLSERYQIQSRAYSPSFEPNCGHNAVSVRSVGSGLEPPTVWGADRRSILNPMLMLMYVLLSLLFVSIPWEFCRLYQLAVSSRAAVASAGVPVECSPESLSLLQTLRLWLSQQLAWSHDNPCDRYYEAMFVDPLWEVTPFMVVVSVLTRCLVHPAELLSAGLGRALRNFFTQIPLHWQPVCMLLVLAVTLLTLLMTCSYRLSVPLLFRVEPRTPVLVGGKGGGGVRKTGGTPDFRCRSRSLVSSQRAELSHQTSRGSPSPRQQYCSPTESPSSSPSRTSLPVTSRAGLLQGRRASRDQKENVPATATESGTRGGKRAGNKTVSLERGLTGETTSWSPLREVNVAAWSGEESPSPRSGTARGGAPRGVAKRRAGTKGAGRKREK